MGKIIKSRYDLEIYLCDMKNILNEHINLLAGIRCSKTMQVCIFPSKLEGPLLPGHEKLRIRHKRWKFSELGNTFDNGGLGLLNLSGNALSSWCTVG